MAKVRMLTAEELINEDELKSRIRTAREEGCSVEYAVELAIELAPTVDGDNLTEAERETVKQYATTYAKSLSALATIMETAKIGPVEVMAVVWEALAMDTAPTINRATILERIQQLQNADELGNVVLEFRGYMRSNRRGN